MPVYVSKFGGTSLSSGERFQNVLNIVRMNECRRFIILSAPGKRFKGDQKITDLLLTCAKSQKRRDFKIIRERFLSIADTVGVSVKEALDEAEENIFSGAGEAYAASRGEYLSAKIFSEMSGRTFLDAKDAVFFKNGSVDKIRTKQALLNAFQSSGSVVMPGFYGADENKCIRLLPRGGSDTSGAIAAALIGADAYENWTDVDGVYKKDPNRFPDQTPERFLTFDETERILNAGASVLHPDCLYWAKKSGVPIFVKNSFAPHLPGTRIGP